MKGLLKLVAVLFVVLLAAVVVVLVILAGLFVWLKLTEEPDDEALDLEPELDSVEEAIGDTGSV
jgi:flagellar basal body-associated protein FliL